MKGNVIYVAPDGTALDKDSFVKYKEHFMNVWEGIKDLIRSVVKELKRKLDAIVDNWEKEDNHKCGLRKFLGYNHTPRNIHMSNQVMNKKPMSFTARSTL